MKDKSLQIENGNFTRIANAILDSLVSAQISGSELRIVLAVIRKTYGYQKKEDSISLSQLQKITNISKRNIIYLLQNLEAKKILIISRSNYQCNLIRFNKYSDTWVVQSYAQQVKKNRDRAKEYSAKLRNGVVQSYEGSAKLGTKVVQNSVKKGESFAHTKDNTKENKERTKFKIPSLDEITKYCLARNNNIDPEHFLNKHIANGWMVGKNKMKDWQATIRTWERQPWNKPKELTLKQRIQETIKTKGNLKIGKVNLSDLVSCMEMVEDGSIDKQFDNITQILNSEEFKNIII